MLRRECSAQLRPVDAALRGACLLANAPAAEHATDAGETSTATVPANGPAAEIGVVTSVTAAQAGARDQGRAYAALYAEVDAWLVMRPTDVSAVYR